VRNGFAALLGCLEALFARYLTCKKVTDHNQYAAKACPSFNTRTSSAACF